MKIKERRGVKHSTLVRYRQMLKDIYEEIGYVHLVDIKPQMLNQFYESLEKGTARKTPERATPKVDFKQYLKNEFSEMCPGGVLKAIFWTKNTPLELSQTALVLLDFCKW